VRALRLALSLTALVTAAAGLAGPVAAAPTVAPRIQDVQVVAPRGGFGHGHVVLLVDVRYVPVLAALRDAPDPARSDDVGRIRAVVRARGAAVGTFQDTDQLIRDAARPFRVTDRIVLPARASGMARAARRLTLTLSASQSIEVGGRRDLRGLGVGRMTTGERVRAVRALPRPARPRCEQGTLRASYGRTTRLAVVCMGEDVRIHVARGPRHGRVTVLSSDEGRVVFSYRAPGRYVGDDRLVLRASEAGSSILKPVRIRVQPFELRALGDSVTAGFGYLENGSPWGLLSLPSCIPPTPPNNRCSSNSPNGIGSVNPVGWSPDFGLGNQVSWPAQFAHTQGITGPGQYENWAVSGSTPTDWASGYLNSTLQGIVADEPDLVVLTLGANPLLDTFLFGEGLECAISLDDNQLRACVQSFVDQVRLVPNIQSVLSQLLQSPNTRVVESQYHLAIPSAALYSTHQLEVMFDLINGDIVQAVQGVQGYGTRLFLMRPPRFDVGRGPGDFLCDAKGFTVDGPSKQSEATQTEFALNPFIDFCGSTDYWIISADTGIHPSVAGYAQFAGALEAVVQAHHLLPPLP